MLGFEMIQMPMWDYLDEIAEELGTKIEPGESEFWLCSQRLRLLVDPLSQVVLSSTVTAIAVTAHKLQLIEQKIEENSMLQMSSKGVPSQTLVAGFATEFGTSCTSTSDATRSILPLSPCSPTSPALAIPFEQSAGALGTQGFPIHCIDGAHAESRDLAFPRKVGGGAKPRIGSF
jgi:hypothetical protein